MRMGKRGHSRQGPSLTDGQAGRAVEHRLPERVGLPEIIHLAPQALFFAALRHGSCGDESEQPFRCLPEAA
jgi:hypothetical protein